VIENNFFLKKITHLTIYLSIWCSNTLKLLSVALTLSYNIDYVESFLEKTAKMCFLGLSHVPYMSLPFAFIITE